jgi:hypothetical protein
MSIKDKVRNRQTISDLKSFTEQFNLEIHL